MLQFSNTRFDKDFVKATFRRFYTKGGVISQNSQFHSLQLISRKIGKQVVKYSFLPLLLDKIIFRVTTHLSPFDTAITNTLLDDVINCIQ